MIPESISSKQKIYDFYGNNYPYTFFSIKNTKGFISNGYFYKEIKNENENEPAFDYVKSPIKVKADKRKSFKHIVNAGYYIILVIVLFAAYNSNCFLEVFFGGGLVGASILYTYKQVGGITQSIMLLSMVIALLFGFMYEYYNIAYILFFAISFYLALDNYFNTNIVYKPDGTKGYYIWTTGEPAYTIEEKINNIVVVENTTINIEEKEL